MRVTSYPAEWVALLEGVKPALRLWRDRAKAAAEAHAARRRGFAVAEVAVPGVTRHRAEAHPVETPARGAGAAPRAIVYVARTPAAARALQALEAPILPGQAVRPLAPADLAAHRALGEALGYPACCIEAFVERVERGVTRLPSGAAAHEDFVAASLALARSRALVPLCNVFAAGRNRCWLSHVPCRLDCEASIAYATAVRAAYLRHGPAAAAEMDRELALDVAIGRDGRRSALADAAADACRLGFAMGLDPAGAEPVR